MKKVLSFILAFATVSTMAVSAIADEAKAAAGLSFGADAESEKTMQNLLTPGEEYQFPIYITNEEGKTEQIQDKHLDGHKLRVEIKDGKSAVESVKVEEGDNGYVLEVETVSGWPTKQTEFVGALKMVKKTNGQSVYTVDINFTVGYGKISASSLEGVKNGEYVFIEDSAPVISQEQMKKLESYANGKKVTFTNGDWTYEVRISDQEAVNMLNNQRTIREVVEKFEDNNFKFVSFPAGPEFDFNGTMNIDVADEMDEFENFFVYRYYKGKLTKMDAKLDKNDKTVSFETKTLGRFVITDKAIEDGTVVESGFGGETTAPSKPSNPGTSTKPNPSMGAGNMAGMTTAFAVLLMVTSTAAMMKKYMK